MNKQLIDKYVGLELSIRAFQLEHATYTQKDGASNYIDTLERAIQQIKLVFFHFKNDVIDKYHMHVVKIDPWNYRVHEDVYTYSSEELQTMTQQVMASYLASL